MNYDLTPEMDISEAIRWCFRHHACVDFFGDGDRHTYMRITTPVRGELDCHRVTVRVPHHDAVSEVFVDVVETVRKCLNYE